MSNKVTGCVFCGSAGPLTREHVFGKWLGALGLSDGHVQQVASPLNGLKRDLGFTPPFLNTVRNVCGVCNNGWMSDLEAIAKRALTSHIIGTEGEIAAEDRRGVAAWALKTALVAMLLSSEEQRQSGYGLPSAEYRALRASELEGRLLPGASVWIGRYDGIYRAGLARVVPFIVHIAGRPDPGSPQGYFFTVAVGNLILFGARFTNPSESIELAASARFRTLAETVVEPSDRPLVATGDRELLAVAAGSELKSSNPDVAVVPWWPASHLPESRQVGDLVAVPALCGKHVVWYPIDLVRMARRNQFFWFQATCGCRDLMYLLRTDSDRVRFRSADTPKRVRAEYEALTGSERVLSTTSGPFVYRVLTSADW